MTKRRLTPAVVVYSMRHYLAGMTIRISVDDAAERLSELTRRASEGETVVITDGGKAVVDLVAHREKAGLSLDAGDEFLRERGVKEIFPYVAKDFDEPLPEDILLRPLP